MSERQNSLVVKLSRFLTLSPEEASAIRALQSNRQIHTARRELVQEGQRKRPVLIVCDGWCCSFKKLPDGSRQIIDFLIPGDLFGVGSGPLHSSDRGFATVTAAEIAEVPLPVLSSAFRQWPRIRSAMRWAMSRQAAILAEHLVNVGRRSALVRTAHLLLELEARLNLIDHETNGVFTCPLTQQDLADALGLTTIHINRTLRDLRQRRLLAFQNSQVEFIDRAALIELTQFNLAYLD
ncbi:Crp/Fnr family transcriptional regulator [Inquilinus limosus]|uniref:Crp/Fnr family transcriptional regulator n=1 Tax=Inquilinus limosus TaxID=171674 RepID=UPI003F15F7FF